MKNLSATFLILLFSISASVAQWNVSGTNIYNSNTGNVGIGTTTPTKKLEIVGNGTTAETLVLRNDFINAMHIISNTSGASTFQAAISLLRSRGTNAAPTDVLANDRIATIGAGPYINGAYRSGAMIEFSAGNSISPTSHTTNIRFHTTGTNQTSRVERLRITEDGKVGIGTTTPAHQLDVNGTVNATAFYVNGQPFTGGGSSQWTTTASNIYFNTGNVGIGTSTPTKKLEIVGNGTTAETLVLRNDFINAMHIISNTSGASTFQAAISLLRSRGTNAAPTDVLANDRIATIGAGPYINGAYRSGAMIEFSAGNSISPTSHTTNIRFHTTGTNQTSRVERLRITEDGKVGIGTTTPAYQLDVNGTVNATALYVNGQPFTGSGSSQWTTTASNIYFNTGNVGVGTTNPAHKLDVNGAINATALYINGQPFAGGGTQWTTSGTNISYNAPGVVSIGTSTAPIGYKLAVGGKMIAEEILVKLQGSWPDYVFEAGYKFPTLEELSQYISKHKHLPGVPSAKEIHDNGVNVGEMNVILLEKIEELTLHLIEMKEQLNAQQKIVQELSKKD